MKAVVLFSGGQDSTTVLYHAMHRFGVDQILALTIDYGQRHKLELAAAKEIANAAGVRQLVLETAIIADLGDSALVAADEPITASGGRTDTVRPDGMSNAFVPGRNLLFCSIATSVAAKFGAKTIVTGIVQTTGSGYPDCRVEFVKAMQAAASLALPSSDGPITLWNPIIEMSKSTIVSLAKSLGSDCWEALGKTATCYNGQRPGCGECPACKARAKGFADANLADPAEEKHDVRDHQET